MNSALRLRRQADFEHVRRAGKVYRHPVLLISVCANALPHNRYGIVAGKRLGIAVARNRCKRRLRAALRQMHDTLRQGFDIIVVARRNLIGQPFAGLLRILSKLFMQAQLIETC